MVDSRRCLVKGVFGGEEGAGYEVLLWDGGVMWTEKLEEEGMVERMAVSAHRAKICPNFLLPDPKSKRGGSQFSSSLTPLISSLLFSPCLC